MIIKSPQKPLFGARINWHHPLANSIVGCWLFNEGSGQKVYDLSGNQYHGTFVNMDSSNWRHTDRGLALYFDGNDEYIDLGTVIKFGTGPFTLSAWYKGTDNTGWAGLCGSHNLANQGYAMMHHNLVAAMSAEGDQDNGSVSISDNIWHHIVVMRNGTVGWIYVDSIPDSSPFATSDGNVDDSGINTMIGGWGDTSYLGEGLINDVRFYNRVLSPGEIQQLYKDPYVIFEQPRRLYVETSIQDYSRETADALKGDDAQLSTVFVAGDYTLVATDDEQYVDQDITDDYATFLFKDKNEIEKGFSVRWNGQSNLAPTSSTIYLQIYNRNTTTWETLDSNDTEDADTDFDLVGSVTEDLDHYFDANGWVACRVYQQGV